MSLISVCDLHKEFQIRKRAKGFWNNLSSLFSREYTSKVALDRISFDVHEGEIVGYIGPNGAGKSTTVKILSGILVPDGGQVKVFGKTPWEHRIETVSQIGVVFGQRTQLWWDLPVIDSFELLKEIYRIPTATYQTMLDSLCEALSLHKLLDIPVRQLSLGQRMRCDLAAALLHAPKILFLDEPTIGLDAVSKLAVRDFIRRLNREHRTTVMLTTHDMDDIEALCDRIIVLNEGRIFYEGTLDGLRKQIAPEMRLMVDLVNAGELIEDLAVLSTRQEGHRVWLTFNPEQISAPELIARIVAKHAVRDLVVQPPPIEEIIAALYREANL
ncbi:MAG: ABC transporter ATP-binding protein [Chlamydiia bacterium]